MKFKLGQKVKYKKVLRKNHLYIEEADFDDEEVVIINKTNMVNLNKERCGFIVGERNISKKAEYTFNDDDPDCHGHIEHQNTETIKVYKVAYDMAHTNYVLEEDLEVEV